LVQRVLLLLHFSSAIFCLAWLLCPSAAGVSAVEAFGAELDIEDTGFVHVDKGQVSAAVWQLAPLNNKVGLQAS